MFTFGGNVSFKHFVYSAFRTRYHRLALEPWTRDATRALRSFVYATGRALRQNPGDAPALANLSKHLADRLRLLWCSSASGVDLEALVGGRIETPASRWFAGFLAGDIAWARARAGEVDERDFAREILLLEAAARAPAASRPARYMVADARWRLASRLADGGRHQELDALYDELADRLYAATSESDDLGPNAWALLEVAESWAQREGGPPRPAEATRLMRWLEERAGNLDQNSQVPRIEALRTRLGGDLLGGGRSGH